MHGSSQNTQGQTMTCNVRGVLAAWGASVCDSDNCRRSAAICWRTTSSPTSLLRRMMLHWSCIQYHMLVTQHGSMLGPPHHSVAKTRSSEVFGVSQRGLILMLPNIAFRVFLASRARTMNPRPLRAVQVCRAPKTSISLETHPNRFPLLGYALP